MVYWDFFLIIWALVSELCIGDLVLQIHATKQCQRRSSLSKEKRGQSSYKGKLCARTWTVWLFVEYVVLKWPQNGEFQGYGDFVCLVFLIQHEPAGQMTFNLPLLNTSPQVRPWVPLSKSIRKEFCKGMGHGKKKEHQELNQPLGSLKELKQREGKYTKHPLLALNH